MKRTESEQKDSEVCGRSAEESRYPWGLRLHLEQPELDKLSLSVMPIGSEVTITAKAKFVSIHQSEQIDQEKDISCALQITDMDVGIKPDENKVAERMYGDKS